MGKNKKPPTGGAGSRITDSRFASFETDPRFRLPSTKKTKTTIDKRFARMLDSDEFTSAAKVDKYGRKLKSDAGKKALKNLYRQEEEDEGEDESDEDKGSAEEQDDEPEIDDHEVEKQLNAAKAYDPARGGGFSSSESEESDVEEEEEDVDVGASMQRFADEQADIEEGDVTNRIAVVNMDWDYIKSHDLFSLFSSFLDKVSGSIEKVSVYPSEFGKERMQREEVEGPPKEIFQTSKPDESDTESDSEAEDERIKDELLQDGDDADFNSDALRAYQLDRLRYYYAVVTFSDPKTAKIVYDATDGTEYLSSSNFIDLRFVPDDVTFDDRPRDECSSVPDSYEPVDFTTNALQSSKVKLTWDMHPEEATRKQSMKKAFGGSRAEIQENDLRAYLASDSEDDGEGDAKEESKKKLREALGLGADGAKDEKGAKDGPVGDMEITFTSALLDEPKEDKEETTIEKYQRKEKERKQKRKERAVANREEQGEGAGEKAGEKEAAGEDDLGFDDPFFTTDEPEVSKSQLRKEERRKKREAKETETAEKAEEKEKLQKMMDQGEQEDGMDKFQHFDMKEIMRAEKNKNKKGKKKGKKAADAPPVADETKVPVLDDRFKDMFESHEFAVDTSNPQYTRTETMQKMLEEGRKRKNAGDGEDGERREKKKKRKEAGADVDLNGLVASVKQKAKKKGEKTR